MESTSASSGWKERSMHRYTALFLCSLSVASVASAATSTAPAAYVYVSTSKGINLYDVASTGKLTLVSGSPFKTTGLMIGSNGKYFITLGTDYVHSYLIGSNGAIKQQESQINTQFYSGADCGTTGGAVLDHTGQDLYVSLNNAEEYGGGVCEAFQTFKINSTSGALTFLGSTVFENEDRFAGTDTLPTLTGNGTGIDIEDVPQSGDHVFNVFSRESNGTLNYIDLSYAAPQAQPGSYYYPVYVTADPANHLAVATSAEQDPPSGPFGSVQLASYSVDSQGNLSSTNTWQNMPTPSTGVSVMNMSPSGKILAVGGSGLLVYHFNGAAPITPYSATLTTAPIGWIHWDNSNHLYALSASKLYVFTVTPTNITPAPGSPYTIATANGLFVVPK
jgi:hypothetical protein